jgi:hypothetical protein
MLLYFSDHKTLFAVVAQCLVDNCNHSEIVKSVTSLLIR